MRITARFIGLVALVAPLIASAPAPVDLEARKPVTTLFSERDAPNGMRNVDDFLGNELNRLYAKYSHSFTNFEANMGRANALFNVSSARHIQKRATVSLTDLNNEARWVGDISTGTPAQTIKTDFDTGSSDFVLYPGSYDPSQSSTSSNLSRTFQIQYGDGTGLSGDVYQDTVSVGGLVATKQAVGSATQSSIQSSGDKAITGLGFPSISTLKADPVHVTLINEGKMSPVFAFGLSTSQARLDLGGLDAGSYLGSIAYSDVDSSQGFWSIAGSLNGASISNAVIDTGTSLILGPVNEVSSACTAAGGTVQTSDGQTLCLYDSSGPIPNFTFTFGGKGFKLSDAAMNYATMNGKTASPIIGADIGVSGWIIGDAFLRDVYAVFNYGDKQVGFAPRQL